MKTLCSIAVVGLVLLGMAAPYAGAAEKIDGNDLLQQCQHSIRLDETKTYADVTTLMGAVHCLGFVNGLIILNRFYEAQIKPEGKRTQLRLLFCLPSGMPTIQAIRVIVRYLETHPERLHEDGSWLTILALNNAFPCSPDASRPQR